MNVRARSNKAPAKHGPKPRMIVQRPEGKPRAQKPQSVDEFLRQGGKIEVLPMHACSQPLKRIGYRGISDATWRRRQEEARA